MAVLLTNKDIEKVESDIVDLVFGYIRHEESSLNGTSIPMEIALICLTYYYFDDNEYFENVHRKILVCDSEKGSQNCSIQTEENDYNARSAFGNVLISSCFDAIYVWKFLILECNRVLYIGISTEFKDEEADFYEWIEIGHNYMFDDCGYFEKNGDMVLNIENGFYAYDVVTMKLDLNNKTLKFKCSSWEHADEGQERGFENIDCGLDIYYKMVVVFCGEGKIELLDFYIDEQ